MHRFSNTWSLMKSSFRVLKEDAMILIFPILSGIFTLLIIGSFMLPFFATGSLESIRFLENQPGVLGYIYLFLFYFLSYFVMLFFNSASVVYAIEVMRGGRPTISQALKMVTHRITPLLGWTFIASTVGLIINSLENSSDSIGKIFSAFLGLSWTVISFLVLPILIVEGKGPVTSLKLSAKMLKNSWGEQLIGHFSFGLLFALISFPIFFIIFLSLQFGGAPAIAGIAVGVLLVIGMGVVQWSLQSIFMGAIYLFVRKENIPSSYSITQISNAFH
ncbi:MAG: DUF6159 family protein [Balneolaceae bacterium]|nr:DUF6159 family protein [Balneolaceae bacterium]